VLSLVRFLSACAVVLCLGFASTGAQSAAAKHSSGPRSAAPKQSPIAQQWIDGWNSPDPAKLVEAFTPDAYYRDVPSDAHYQGSAELRKLHKSFHDAVGGLYVKLVAMHIRGGHGTIEWIFGGTDVGLYKTGKPFAVPGVSVIEVRNGHISRNLDYYDMASIMQQVGVLPAK
jgi:steroid delta-isomerase-like uncharacterized protein